MYRHAIDNCEVQRFEQVWQERTAESKTHADDSDAWIPQGWVIAQILALCEECSDRPIAELLPMIRLILDNSRYACDAGDSVVVPASAPNVDRQMELIAATLEEMRRLPA